MEIPLPQTGQEDIYNYGFNKNLYRPHKDEGQLGYSEFSLDFGVFDGGSIGGSTIINNMPSYFITQNITSGGSLVAGGSNTQVQYNDNGSFGGHPGLTYVPSTTTVGILYLNHTLSSTQNTDLDIKTPNSTTGWPGGIYLTGGNTTYANTTGGEIYLQTGTGTRDGGNVTHYCGNGGRDGGSIYSYAGDGNRYGGWNIYYGGDGATDAGGGVGMIAGKSDEKNGGWANLVAGRGGDNGVGGSVWIEAGSAKSGTNNKGGDVWIYSGPGYGTGDSGDIWLEGAWNWSNNKGLIKITGGNFITPALFVNGGWIRLAENLTDAYGGAINIESHYQTNDSDAFTVARHNYIKVPNFKTGSVPSVSPARSYVQPADACLFQFDADAGTHKAVDSGTTKTTPGTVDAWVKVNLNGTIRFIPSYTSKTS
jgi:hypothetical protein